LHVNLIRTRDSQATWIKSPLAKALSLLQTCRQTNAETKLLPYIHSTISVKDDNDEILVPFIEHTLTLAQLKAIRTIELVLDRLPNSFSCDTPYNYFAKLPGLKRVNVLITEVHEVFNGFVAHAKWRKTMLIHGFHMSGAVFEETFRAEDPVLESANPRQYYNVRVRAPRCTR
jgi:hypothetical protein